jgi:amino acid transporter
MPKKRSQAKSATTIKRDLEITERELRRVTEFQWVYAKRMLRFGFFSWVFGLLLFFFILVIRGLEFLGRLSLAYPLLIIAIAVPIFITAFFVHKFNAKIKRLERVRKLLLTDYEQAILKRTSTLIKKN